MKSKHKGIEFSDPIQCPKCDYFCYDKYNFKKHVLRHEDEKGSIYICNICQKVSKNRFTSYAHTLYAHLGEEKHKCSFCNLKFKRKSDLKKHLSVHESNNLLECPDCGGNFKNISRVNLHRKKKHPKEFEEYEKNEATLTNGTLILAKNEKPSIDNGNKRGYKQLYKCNFCDKEFRSLVCLKEHAAIHTGIPIYSCSFCPLVFNASAAMFRHLNHMHPKESKGLRGKKVETMTLKTENFDCVCKECGITTDNFNALIAHTKEVHQKDGLYRCIFCKKKFKRRHNLINHMATHDNEKAVYNCSLCSFICGTSNELNNHAKKNTS